MPSYCQCQCQTSADATANAKLYLENDKFGMCSYEKWQKLRKSGGKVK
jgi:hypothetical protein